MFFIVGVSLVLRPGSFSHQRVCGPALRDSKTQRVVITNA